MRSPKPDYEQQKIDLEREKYQAELSIKQKELEQKDRELNLKEQELNKDKNKLSPTNVTIIVALIGIFGTLLASVIQSYNNGKAEAAKFQSELILKATSSKDLEQNKKNLQFFLKAGIIKDNQSTLYEMVRDSDFDVPFLNDIANKPKLIITGLIDNDDGRPVDPQKTVVNIHTNNLEYSTNTTNGTFQFEMYNTSSEQIHIEIKEDEYLTREFTFRGNHFFGNQTFHTLMLPDLKSYRKRHPIIIDTIPQLQPKS